VDFILNRDSNLKLLTLTGSVDESRRDLIYRAITFVFVRNPGRYKRGIHRINNEKISVYHVEATEQEKEKLK